MHNPGMKFRTRRFLSTVAVITALFAGMTTPAAQAAPVPVGGCQIKANQPHGSSHKAGTINMTGTVKCTRQMQSIRIYVYILNANGKIVKRSLGKTFTRTSSAMQNVAIPCHSDRRNYRGQIWAGLTAPAGVKPSYGEVVKNSALVSVKCDNAPPNAKPQSAGMPTSISTTSGTPFSIEPEVVDPRVSEWVSSTPEDRIDPESFPSQEE